MVLHAGPTGPHRSPTTSRHGGRSPQEPHGLNGTLRYTGDSDGSVYEFSTVTDRALTGLTPPGQHGPVNAVAFSPDGTLLAAADGNGHAYVWNATDKIVGSYAGTGGWPVWGVTFSLNGKLLAIADGDGNL